MAKKKTATKAKKNAFLQKLLGNLKKAPVSKESGYKIPKFKNIKTK